RILTCHRGIDVNRFSPGAASERAPASVIVTRNLCSWYRIDVIVKAMALARDEVGDLTGSIVGDGDAEQDLRQLADELGVAGAVKFTGRVAHEDLPPLLAGSSIYVSAVRTDGVSASLLEAMSTGCFPIVRDNAANRHWIEHGQNGFLVAEGTPAAYAEAITTACRDHELLANAARRNREIVTERADSARNMRTIERAYQDLIDRT
ncbi:MAG: glycosyltransferase, partial [Candidatus Eisenbacteria bacterium]|nr:glycosyltransferase [Candidatus Eisenbacteria bacterium]